MRKDTTQRLPSGAPGQPIPQPPPYPDYPAPPRPEPRPAARRHVSETFTSYAEAA